MLASASMWVVHGLYWWHSRLSLSHDSSSVPAAISIRLWLTRQHGTLQAQWLHASVLPGQLTYSLFAQPIATCLHFSSLVWSFIGFPTLSSVVTALPSHPFRSLLWWWWLSSVFLSLINSLRLKCNRLFTSNSKFSAKSFMIHIILCTFADANMCKTLIS